MNANVYADIVLVEKRHIHICYTDTLLWKKTEVKYVIILQYLHKNITISS